MYCNMEWIRYAYGFIIVCALWITIAGEPVTSVARPAPAPGGQRTQDLHNEGAGSFVATECYGSVLSLTCSPGHRIKVLDDFFGVSTGRIGTDQQCRYQPGDCTVTNSRFTSVIHRYCEGKPSCSSFQVDRRHCGANHTTYEQVEYECVSDAQITDMCRDVSYSAQQGYISTPNFPSEYPPNVDCTCLLRASSGPYRIRLEATHFIVKFDNPCKDWLEIRMGGRTRRLCGAYKSTLKGNQFKLAFHSDDEAGHQGVWMYYSVYPKSKNASIEVQCGKTPKTTTILPVTTKALLLSSTTLFNENVSPEPPDDIFGLYSDDITTVGSATKINQRYLNQSATMPTQFLFTSLAPAADEPLIYDSNNELEIYEDSTSGLDDVPTTDMEFVSTMMRKTTLPSMDINDYDEEDEDEDEEIWLSIDEEEYILSDTVVQNNNISGVDTYYNNKYANGPTSSDMSYFGDYRTLAGLIIISLCAGGILILILVLIILMCVNKKKKPRRIVEKERKRRMQQRLNSLNFYDSIPLYDSIGRRAGSSLMHLSGLAIPASIAEGNENESLPSPSRAVLETSGSSSSPLTLDVRNLGWQGEGVPVANCWTPSPNRDGPVQHSSNLHTPNWATPSPSTESDCGSAMYAELGLHCRSMDMTSQSGDDTLDTLATPYTGCTPNGDGPPGYGRPSSSRMTHRSDTGFSVQLKHAPQSKEDIYTHV